LTVFGGGSIQLARVLGVRIGVDASWFFVLFLVIWSLSGYYDESFSESTAFALAVGSAMLFFLSILLHELGHAVVAMRNGIGIAGIDLWMFGGVAKMERDTDSPGLEFKVAIAGPVVTLAIAAACFIAGMAISNADAVIETTRFEGERFSAAVAVLSWLTTVNVFLLAFNLIPGFPLDGGRIARAIVWWRTGDRNRATRVAARLGRGFAFIMIAAGAYLFVATGDFVGGAWLAVIGFFLSQAARSAEYQTAMVSRIEGLRVSDVMDAEPVAIPEALDLERALDDYFRRYWGWAWFPVVDAGGHPVGLVTRQAIEQVPLGERVVRSVSTVTARDEGGGLSVHQEEPLEALLGLEGLQRLGALMAVDADGVLRGIVTLDHVRRALRAPGAVA
jgi:Zn-dependent protease